jgi:hypothetical protein
MYTYSDLKHIYDGRRGDKYDRAVRGLNNCRVSSLQLDGKSYMAVTMYSTRIGIVDQDNVWMVTMGGWDSKTTKERIYEISGVSITNDHRTTGLDNTTRMNGLPYSGELKWRGGHCINPEVAPVDKITTLKRSAVAAVTKKLRTLKALMTTMARCEMFDRHAGTTRCMPVFTDEELANPTAEHAETLFKYGLHRSYNGTPSMAVAECALKFLRHAMYEDNPNNFDTKVISYGNDQRLAA